MAVTLNNAGGSTGDGGNTTLTLSVTVVAGSNTVLIAFTNIEATGVTYGGTALTLLDTGTAAIGGQAGTKAWRLSAPTVGTANLVMTRAASDRCLMSAIVLDGWDSGTPTYDYSALGFVATPSSRSVTIPSGGMAVTWISDNAQPTLSYSGASGLTKASEFTAAAYFAYALGYKAGAASTVDWSWASGDRNVHRHTVVLSGVAAAPVITAPTGAATGNTTANAGATIDAVSGSGSRIMYALARIGGSAASSATIIATGTQLAITSAGAKSVPLTGLTNGASYSADIVYVDATTGTSNVVTSSWTQTAAPVLSSPTNTPGSTTALIGATTTVSSGTAYFLARVGGSAASAATIIATGQTSTVSTTTPSRTVTGLTASTSNNFVDIVQVSGVTTSNVVSTAAFTTTSSGDTTVPTLGGSVIIGTVTSSSIQTSLSQAGADNVGVTSYEVSTNGGGSWLDIGIPGGLSYTFPGLSASTSYPLWWRAKDAAGNVSAALTATQSTAAASGVGSINLNNAALYTFKTNNGAPIVSTGLTFYVHNVTTGALVGSAITGLSTDIVGVVTTAISNGSMLAGTQYRLVIESSTGKYGSIKLTAV